MLKLCLISKCLIILSLLLICNTSCYNLSNNESYKGIPDTLKIGTLYSPTSFFIYKGDTLGYEYERIKNFASDKKIQTKFHIAQMIFFNFVKASDFYGEY